MGTLLTVNEAAQRMGVNRDTVYQWIRRGRLPAVRLSPRVIRIPEKALHQFDNEPSAQTNPETHDQWNGVVVVSPDQLTRLVEDAVRRAVQEAVGTQGGGPSEVEDGNGLLTTSEVARRLGVQRTTVYRWVQEGRLPSVRLSPRTIRVPAEALKNLLDDGHGAEGGDGDEQH